MRIGELAVRTGVSVRALRYYEEHGLLSSGRTGSGQRVYADTAVDRVLLLRQLFDAGLSSTTIARVLPCVDSPSIEVTEATVATLRDQHARLERQIADLIATREHLGTVIAGTSEYLRSTREAVPA